LSRLDSVATHRLDHPRFSGRGWDAREALPSRACDAVTRCKVSIKRTACGLNGGRFKGVVADAKLASGVFADPDFYRHRLWLGFGHRHRLADRRAQPARS